VLQPEVRTREAPTARQRQAPTPVPVELSDHPAPILLQAVLITLVRALHRAVLTAPAQVLRQVAQGHPRRRPLLGPAAAALYRAPAVAGVAVVGAT